MFIFRLNEVEIEFLIFITCKIYLIVYNKKIDVEKYTLFSILVDIY